MSVLSNIVRSCACGRPLEVGAMSAVGELREVSCPCGRLLDLAGSAAGWTLRGTLTPERSVPVSGFSTELRARPDTERYWFEHRGGPANKGLIVHVVLSPSAREAEVKALGMKALRLSGVTSPAEARRRWVALHDAPGGINRMRKALRPESVARASGAAPSSGWSAP